MPVPTENISRRISQAFVPSPTKLSRTIIAATQTMPAAISRRGPIRG